MDPAISQTCRDKIIAFEIGSRAYYDKFAKHPSWPGGLSGITIGIGYDLGQHTVQQFIDDWSGTKVNYIPALQAVCGHTGANAKWLLHTVSDISIPYADAYGVFNRVILPHYVALTAKALPNCNRLPPDAFGVLVDLVYNRGPDVTSLTDSRSEMRAIKNAMLTMNFSHIPVYLRSMKRLWPNSRALQTRRDWEADTFEHAIVATPPGPVVPVPAPVQVRPPIVPTRPLPVPTSEDDIADELNRRELERIRGRL